MREVNNLKNEINVAIIGATGYTGIELIRLLLLHPNYRIVCLTSDTKAGKTMEEIFPHLNSFNLPSLVKVDNIDFSNIDAIFCCVPHGTTQDIIAQIPKDIKICDLSADFRFEDINLYEKTYGVKHTQEMLQKEAVYGLTEIYRKDIKGASLVACPGCYPTSVLLPLLPLVKNKIIKMDNIIVDSKSGVSGAGRSLRESLLFSEVSDGFSAYGMVKHRHKPEIISQLMNFSESKVLDLTFTPHLLPTKRGILSTIYFDSKSEFGFRDVNDCLKENYANDSFVHLIENNQAPSTNDVRGSNLCKFSVFFDEQSKKFIIVSVLDNLVKGASGQAIQNMNLMMGIDETSGLFQGVTFP